MSLDEDREQPRHPHDLERLLLSRQSAGDVDGMVGLYEIDAAIDRRGGKFLVGPEEIRAYFAEGVAGGRKLSIGEQRQAVICGDLALTSTRLPDGSVTSEAARRQAAGRWLWVIDKSSLT